MKNQLFTWKAVQTGTGTYKAQVGARGKTFWKSEPVPNQIV
jgi:hypothetical protein